jgi:sulfur-oxidizing protein SoxB
MGKRISELRLNGQLLDASKVYKVAGWASVSPDLQGSPAPAIWDILTQYLTDIKVVSRITPNIPQIKNMQGNKGLSNI